MTTLVDAKWAALSAHPGAMSDKTLAWLQANGATSPSIPDAWIEMLDAKLVAPATGDRNTDWHALLIQQGMDVTAGSKQLNDMELAFWEGGAILPA
jgi:hypothetical protein